MQSKPKTEQSAIENVKRLFSSTPINDSVSLETAFRAWGRENPEDLDKHKSWLSNELYHLKYHNLVTPDYKVINSRHKIVGIRLTLKGKQVLGRLGESSMQNGQRPKNNGIADYTLTLDQVVKAIPKLRKENPELEITFSVKLKDEV